MVYKYSPGDRVVVRYDLRNGALYKSETDSKISNVAVTGMVERAGSVVTIASLMGGQYWIEEDGQRWRWVDGMFDGLYDSDDGQIGVSVLPLEQLLYRT